MQPAPSKNILIVEDERDVVDLLVLNLQMSIIAVSSASSGGASIWRRGCPDGDATRK